MATPAKQRSLAIFSPMHIFNHGFIINVEGMNAYVGKYGNNKILPIKFPLEKQ